MVKDGKIAVIGDKDSVLAFKAVGVETYAVSSPYEANDVIRSIKEDCAVIFVTEDIAEQISATIDKLKSRPYPAVIPIPGALGSNGFGKRNVHRDVEKAIGADILLD